MLINQSIHTLDLLGQFLGRATQVEASMMNHHLKGVIEVEDMMEAYLTFGGGASAIFYATTASCADSPVLVELACENATIRMEEGQEVSITWADGSKERHSLTSKPVAGGKAYWGDSHGLCIQDFYRCVREGKPFRNDIAGIAPIAAELMLSMYQSAREHTVVEL